MFQFFNFPHFRQDQERSKLSWLVRLRWLALLLFFLLAAPALFFGYLNRETLPVFIGFVAVLSLFNFLTQLIFVDSKKEIGPLLICFQLSMDLVFLVGMLAISGGFTNPLVGLFLVNTSLGGILIHKKLGWPFLLLAHALLAALQLSYIQAHLDDLDSKLWACIVISHLLISVIWRVMRSLGEHLTQQQESQAQSQVAAERMDRLRAIGALAAGFSHEFASPLNSAKLRLERLRRNLSSESQEDVSEALAAIQACEQVIHQMNASQLDVRDFQFKSVKIKELLEDVIDSWRSEHPEVSLKVQIGVDDSLRIPPINFAQVILNLLDNAFEANPIGEINFSFERKDQHQFLLKIRDQGKGFSEAIATRIGEPFVTSKPTGTGLGLYLSQLFIRSLGGDLKVENLKDEGAAVGAQVSLAWPIRGVSGVET